VVGTLTVVSGDPDAAAEAADEAFARALARWDRVSVMESPAPHQGGLRHGQPGIEPAGADQATRAMSMAGTWPVVATMRSYLADDVRQVGTDMAAIDTGHAGVYSLEDQPVTGHR
jgi:hypothetical protein